DQDNQGPFRNNTKFLECEEALETLVWESTTSVPVEDVTFGYALDGDSIGLLHNISQQISIEVERELGNLSLTLEQLYTDKFEEFLNGDFGDMSQTLGNMEKLLSWNFDFAGETLMPFKFYSEK